LLVAVLCLIVLAECRFLVDQRKPVIAPLSESKEQEQEQRKPIVTFSQGRGQSKSQDSLALIEGQYGGTGGSPFIDPGNGPILSVTLYGSSQNPYVGGIQIVYASGFDPNTFQYIPDPGAVHGSTAINGVTLSINNVAAAGNPREFITSISGRSGSYIDTLIITLNDGRSITAGTSTGGSPFGETAPANQMVGLITGNCGSWIDNLDFQWFGPIASFFFAADSYGTIPFEISTQNPSAPLTAVTFYTNTYNGVAYISGLQVFTASQSSSIAGSTGTGSQQITIPSGGVQLISIASCNFGGPVSGFISFIGAATCGVTFTFFAGGSSTVLSASGQQQANYASFVGDGSGRCFRGFKGTFQQAVPTSLAFIFQD